MLEARRTQSALQHEREDLEAALAAVATEEAPAEADAAYRRDMYSTTGPAVHSATWSTWRKIHMKRFGESVPFVPLTVAIVAGILAGFKAGRDRSVANYVSVARSVHIRAGHHLLCLFRLGLFAKTLEPGFLISPQLRALVARQRKILHGLSIKLLHHGLQVHEGIVIGLRGDRCRHR